uniref:hypothetical protein n=1 Tax=Microbacterium sp. SORGH_AS_1204 TaxID=3041785 RepID=UPI0027D857B0|nr:hypothetical protein [Microbacterium sp. SORGH_AS_1204]
MVTKSRKARANEQAQEILNARRKEQGLPSQKTGKTTRKKPKPVQHREPPRNRTEERTNVRGEKVIAQFGTTKASKRNPVRLTDGRTHPVSVRFLESGRSEMGAVESP